MNNITQSLINHINNNLHELRNILDFAQKLKTIHNAPERNLSEDVKYYFYTKTEQDTVNSSTLTQELLNAALKEVNWQELANYYKQLANETPLD